MMNELTERQEAILIECLETLDSGGDLEACLSQYPQDTDALRPYLTLRARMLTTDQPEPPAPAYQAGRQALVDELARPSSARKRWPLIAAFGVRWGRPAEAFVSACRRATSLAVGGFGRIESPLARAVAVTALLFVLGGGALGAAATVGFQPAREVLSTLRLIEDNGDDGSVGDDSEDGRNAGGDDEGGPKTGDGEGDASKPPASETEEPEGDEPEADEPDDGGSDDGNEKDGEDEAAGPDLEAKPPDEEPRLDDTPTDSVQQPTPRHNEPAPGPGHNEPALTPVPTEPEPTPKPDNPTPTPKPEEPTKTPEPDDPTPTPKPEEPEPTPKPEEATPTPKPEEPTPSGNDPV